MSYNPSSLFIFCVLLQLFVQTTAEDGTIEHYCNYDYDGIYTSNSAFRKNIEAIPSILNRSEATFFNFSIGKNPEVTNVIALCRGDVGVNRCQRCLGMAYSELTRFCTKEKESIIWKDKCMLRYSDRNILKTMSSLPNAYAYNSVLAQNGTDFNKKVRSLLDKLQAQAIASVSKFVTGNASVAEDRHVYGLVQCTPDLTTKDCKECLDGAFAELPICCDGKIGGRDVRPSCNFRYETRSPFYYNSESHIPEQQQQQPPQPDGFVLPPPPGFTGKGSDDSKTKIIIAIVSTSMVILFCIGICIYCSQFKKQRNTQKTDDIGDDPMSSEESLYYDFNTVKFATDDFSENHKLGQGGFGVVYKGQLPDGRDIAVKRLLNSSGQGELEFKNEVLLLAKLQHRSLLRLLGYSLKATERLLIYEFIANGSLDHYLFDTEKRKSLDLETRFKIIAGVARGILYLHEDSRLRIIHRDLKPSNILLDAEMYPKIADFGMARLFETETVETATNRIVGTYGYMPPEYVVLGQFSVKSDIFSFGVVVLEIITGQKNSFRNEENIEYLPSYVWKNWRDGKAMDVIDPLLRNVSNSSNEMIRCIHIALLCVQENAALRPTMAAVVVMLGNTSMALQVPSVPAFHNNTGSGFSTFQDNTSLETLGSSSKSHDKPLSTGSKNETSLTDLTGR